MSVVGVDLGTLKTVVAVARNRGVDVVCSRTVFLGTDQLQLFIATWAMQRRNSQHCVGMRLTTIIADHQRSFQQSNPVSLRSAFPS